MMIWEYLKRSIGPRDSIRTHVTWGRLFPSQRLDPPQDDKGVPVPLKDTVSRWFFRGRKLLTHKIVPDRQAPRATFTDRTIRHR